MFIDYYAVLGVDIKSSPEEIKIAFKVQALRWHPDRNLGENTTSRMQIINEAYLILKDPEARDRYNDEYVKYTEFKNQKFYEEEPACENAYQKYENDNYTVTDDTLKRWMENARRQAVELAKQTIEDFKGMVKVGAKEAVREAKNVIKYQLIIGGIVLTIITIIAMWKR